MNSSQSASRALPQRLLIANRSVVAARIMRAAQALGMETVVIHSPVDATLPYVSQASAAYELPGNSPMESYLNQDAILNIAAISGADAIHPGYGFLAENAEFARRVTNAGLCFIGPHPSWLERLGEKTGARRFMQKLGMPQTASSDILPNDLEVVRANARSIGYPVLIKPAAGGGGIGMVPIYDEEELGNAWSSAQSIAKRNFGEASLYLEKLVQKPRHIEFQFLADRYGNVAALYERDCSVQRRNQKVLEETRAPGLPTEVLDQMAERLREILSQTGYDVIGTVEMLYTPEDGFCFLEVNTRLQVEHAVTEQLTGTDIVSAQIRLAAGQHLSEVLPSHPVAQGHSIQARIYAEDPRRFIPSPGSLSCFDMPEMEGIRVETGYAAGCEVPRFYDPLLAKIIATGKDRAEAISRLQAALRATRVEGVKTNIPFVLRSLDDPDYQVGMLDVEIVGRILSRPETVAESSSPHS
ncbi:biotin carboxylase N-terminal domain-containing protein [Achromobacter sp. F4_2707]|uniref:acetyl-CoA carboxylase biotin carboxylase subunit n=1 Tax=Achromobacter sp. F4_2707 TaxID=3114286 RepID=UPI0039C5FE29